MKNKNIIITGGLGFIGSHIADELIEDNNVTIIDNLSSGKVENLKNPTHENLTIIKNNLNDIKDVRYRTIAVRWLACIFYFFPPYIDNSGQKKLN